ncbi:type I glyceraldehyde-3-phosphate dehydrogenase [bacterium]|nr:MAG: type I glyceraldehyde-3-phosphate dehydrogenase [bacterium]
MAKRIAINGFGRIGRLIFRRGFNSSELEFVAINDITTPDTLAHLLKYDSIHGRFPGDVKVNGNELIVNGKGIPVFCEREPEKLPWGKLGVEIVAECTGRFREKEQAEKHLTAGAKKVLISAPARGKSYVPTIVLGVNNEEYNPDDRVLSIGSCTTNCIAPVVKVLDDNFGIVHGFMTTVHSYTSDQRLMDLPHRDLRRGRAAAVSQIPTTTGAAKTVGIVLSHLNGKLDGVSIRVPTADGSIVDFVCEVKKETTIDEVNEAFRRAAEGSMKGILEYSTEPLVSTDIIGNPHSSIFDSLLTNVIDGKFIKLFSWYDNEWGFSCRMVDMLKKM